MKNKNTDLPETTHLHELLDLMAAYQKSRILFTFVELEIPKVLNEKSLTALQIAKKKKIQPLAMERFLNGCVTAGLLKKKGNTYLNTEITENFLVNEKKFYLGGQVERHRKRSWEVWSNLTESLSKWNYGDDGKTVPETEDQGDEAMAEQHSLALLHGYELAKALDFSKYKKILDLGGGTGATSIALCKSYAKLEAIVLDLPENVKIAKKFVKKEKLSDRISLIGGDFKKGELPDDFDAVLLANFMSVADADDNKKLLKKLFEKLPEKGVCILSGWIIDDSLLSPQLSVLFCLEDICWNSPDVERSETIYSQWLTEAGFSNIKCETYLEPTKILYGTKK